MICTPGPKPTAPAITWLRTLRKLAEGLAWEKDKGMGPHPRHTHTHTYTQVQNQVEKQQQ